MTEAQASLRSLVRLRHLAETDLAGPAETWVDLIRQAGHHGLAPLLWAALATTAEARLPPGLGGRARAGRAEAARRAERMQRALADIAAIMAEAGVRMVALKGTALARRFYGDPARRVGHDIDILVHERDVERAAALLCARGFTREPRPYALIREDHFVRHGDGLVVDLHWNITGAQFPFALDFDLLWEERQPGEGADLPGDPWLLVMSAVYLVKDYPALRLLYLADFVAVAGRLGEAGWRRAAALAETTGTRRVVALAVLLAERLLDLRPGPGERLVPADRQARAAARRLAAGLDRPGGERQPHLARIAQILGQARLRERRADRMRTRASLVLLLTRPGSADDALAGRIGAAPSLLRPLRLAASFLAGCIARSCAAAGDGLAGLARHARAAATARGLRRLRPAPGVSLHLLDEEGLLFDARGEAIYSLSTSAAWIWCALEVGASATGLRRAYGEAFGRGPEAAAREVDGVLRTWQELGLLDGFGRPATDDRTEPDEADFSAPAPDGLPAAGLELRFRMLDTLFCLGLPGEREAARIAPVLGAFATGRSKGGDVRLQLVASGQGYLLIEGGRIVDRCEGPEGIAPMVKAELLVRAINRYGFSLYLHAAMLRAGDACLLLPAAPGSGKTTLSAALARAGFAYHSDEVTLLDEERLEARGVPLCPTVKEGSWPVLAPLYPGLLDRPLHLRGDDRIVRYLPPPVRPGDPALDRHWPVRWVVFPRYRSGAATVLRPLGRIEALRRMLDECLALRLRLDEAAVARFVSWIGEVDCHELESGSLDEAVQAVQGLCLGECRDPASTAEAL